MDRADFIAKVGTISQIMGYSVTYSEFHHHSPERHRGDLTKGESEITINAGAYGKPGRLVLAGIFPRSEDGYYYGPRTGGHSITVAETKSASVIVKDIRRRLLPDYEKALQEALNNVKRRNAEIKRAAFALHSVGDALGVEPRFSNNREDSGDGVVYSTDLHGFEADYRSSGNFEVKMNLGLQQVLDMIAFLQEGVVERIQISSQDIEAYGKTHKLSESEVDHLLAHLDPIADQVVDFVKEEGWKETFNQACGAYVTGFRMQDEPTADPQNGGLF